MVAETFQEWSERLLRDAGDLLSLNLDEIPSGPITALMLGIIDRGLYNSSNNQQGVYAAPKPWEMQGQMRSAGDISRLMDELSRKNSRHNSYGFS